MTKTLKTPGLLVLALGLALAAPGAFAASDAGGSGGASGADAPSLLVPDRPGFTNGADTVAPGHVQVEAGLTRTKGQTASGGPSQGGQSQGGQSSGGGAVQTTDAPETLIRAGLNAKTELRITLPNYQWPSGSASGFSDGAVGIRYKFYQSKDGNTKLALTPTLSVPLKTAVTSSGRVDPSLTFNAQTQSGARWGLQANLSLAYPTQNGGRVTDYSGSTSASYALSGPLAVFADYYYDAPVGQPPSPTADGGFTYKISKTAQLDLETGRGLGGAAPTQFYGGGLVIVF